MHGFALYITAKKPKLKVEFNWKSTFSFQHGFYERQFIAPKFQIHQFTSKNFVSEKLWIETDDFFIMTDGIVSNLKQLCITYNVKNYTELILKIYKKKDFFKEFTGHFAGFIWIRKNDSFLIFNNHTGTKKIFYYFDDKSIFFSTDLYTLSQAMASLNIKRTLSLDAAYLLLTSGFMHENLTLIDEIKQLRAGEFAEVEADKIVIKSYFHLNQINKINDTKLNTIDNLDTLFKKSIQLEFDLDKNFNHQSLTTLSGGLDSRMVALVAYKLGYKDQLLLNFSEHKYADQVISYQIAKNFNLFIKQVTLNATGLCPIDDIVKINDGLTIYSGSGHVYDALKSVHFNNVGLVHTGMIGDAVLGSFVSSHTNNLPRLTDGLYSKGLFGKVESVLAKYISNYENEEIYKFYNRAFQGANNGFLFFDLVGESSSPFLEPEFLSYAYSMPNKYKFRESIYIDWIKTLHPEIAAYTWEAIGGKPTNNSLIRNFYRVKRAVIKRLPVKSMWKNNMNPEQIWYDNNPLINSTLDTYFNENIQLIESEIELRTDLIHLYTTGNITEKAQVLTLLAAYKLLF